MDESAEDDLVQKVDTLLRLPFEEALAVFPQLKAYIDEHANSDDEQPLVDEFREAWSPDAPQELRDVLEQLIDPEAYEAASKLPLSVQDGVHFGSDELGEMQQDGPSSGKFGNSADEQGLFNLPMDGYETSPAVQRLLDEGNVDELLRLEELDSTMQEESVHLEAVEELLRKSFDEALVECDALQSYLEMQGDERKDVEEEFRSCWSPDAPTELRDVLAQLLDPDAAAENANGTADFVQRMVPDDRVRSKL